MAHLERRAVHMEPRTWPSQTCFVSLLGFVSFSTHFPICNKLQLVTLWQGPRTLSIGWQVGWIRRRCVETGPALRFCEGLGVDKPRSLGSDACRNKSETQCYPDLRRPGSAVRMFMRPFVWAECGQHIHVNVLPGCFQISRANPKRLQLLKRGFVLETHWPHLFGSGVRHKGQLWRTWSAGLFTWSRARGGCRMSRASTAPVSLASMSRASTAPVSLAGTSRASTAPCHGRPPRHSRSRAVSACHERPPRESRSRAVSACHERPPRQSRSRATAPVSLAGGFRMSRASTPPVSLAGGLRMSRASTAPVSLAGGFRMSGASAAPVSLAGGFRMSRASTAPVSLAGGFRLSQASTAPVSLAGGFRLSRASTAPVSLACDFRLSRASAARAVSACHERRPHQSRSRAVSPCHERPPRQSRSRAVSACHERPPRQSSTAPVSLAGGFRMSRASTAPVSLAGGFRVSRASTAPVSLAGGFRMSRAFHRASLARGRFPHVTSVHRANLARGRFPHVTSVHRASLARGRFPHVTSVHRASLARGRPRSQPVSLAGGFQPRPVCVPPASQSRAGSFQPASRTQSAPHRRPPSQPHTAVPPASLVRPVCTPSRHRTPGLQHTKWKSLEISVVTACIAPRHLKRKPKAEPKHQRCFWEKQKNRPPIANRLLTPAKIFNSWRLGGREAKQAQAFSRA